MHCLVSNIKVVITCFSLFWLITLQILGLVEGFNCSPVCPAQIHRLMVSDAPRTQAYATAISKNKHLFEGKVVMDVGAGTGELASSGVYACRIFLLAEYSKVDLL